MDQLFVVRSLPSSNLDGAFRVHLAQEALDLLHLHIGDVCQLTGDDHGGVGYGIAWRATDKMGNSPKLRPAKMTDTLRNAFGFKEGSQVKISKTTAKIQHADKVHLTDVTPVEYGSASEADNLKWRGTSTNVLLWSEAIAVGTTFEVTAKKGLRKRFYVDHIEPATSTRGPGLYYCNDNTSVNIGSAESPIQETTVSNGDGHLPALDPSQIGGLVDQVKELNARLARLLDKSAMISRQANSHMLLYGYEGTGKSLLLDRIDRSGRCRTFRLKKLDLKPSRFQQTIHSAVESALANQPSIILMDDAERWLSPDKVDNVDSFAEALDRLRNTRVLVIAATRDKRDVASSLIEAGRLLDSIELPIPDVKARRHVLSVLMDKAVNTTIDVITAVSFKTHGFTGRDLASLVEKAINNAQDRFIQDGERGDWVDVKARQPTPDDELEHQLDGSVYSQATTQAVTPPVQEYHLPAISVETAVVSDGQPHDGPQQHPRLIITAEDFDFALTKIGPTALREIFLETPKVQWSDIGGSAAIRKRFDKVIGWPLVYTDKLAAADVKPSKGVLLYGPPGCSKTLTAQAVANMYDLNFLVVKGAELISMYVGESERAVREVFRKARQAAPCVIFFDEIDSIGSERESGGGGTKGLNVLTTLLNEMDGFEGRRGVMVLAATNKPEILDPALLRPGRFDAHVFVGLPNEIARREILAINLRKSSVSDLDFEVLVSSTAGFSGSEVAEICNVAKMNAFERSLAGEDGRVNMDDLQDGITVTPKGVTSAMLETYKVFESRGR